MKKNVLNMMGKRVPLKGLNEVLDEIELPEPNIFDQKCFTLVVLGGVTVFDFFFFFFISFMTFVTVANAVGLGTCWMNGGGRRVGARVRVVARSVSPTWVRMSGCGMFSNSALERLTFRAEVFRDDVGKWGVLFSKRGSCWRSRSRPCMWK